MREQLAHFAGFYPHPRDVDEVIAAVGLTEKATARIKSLSGGQRRRVDVALGVIGRPKLLFLDEPTTGFDLEARREFWELIRQLKHQKSALEPMHNRKLGHSTIRHPGVSAHGHRIPPPAR